MDERLRQLERRAAEGDLHAQQTLRRERMRHGLVDRHELECQALEKRIAERTAEIARSNGVVDPVEWAALVCKARATAYPQVLTRPSVKGMIYVHPDMPEHSGRTTGMLLRATALCTLDFRVVVVHPQAQDALQKIRDMVSLTGYHLYNLERTVYDRGRLLHVVSDALEGEAKAWDCRAVVLLDHYYGEAPPHHYPWLWEHAPPQCQQRAQLDVALAAGELCSTKGCNDPGRGLCGMPLIDQGAGCGKLFCNVCLVGRAGPLRCLACRERHSRLRAGRWDPGPDPDSPDGEWG